MHILNTNRLILRTLSKDDFETLYEKIFLDYEVVENTFGSTMFSKEETFEFLLKNGNFDSNIGLSVLEEKETNTIIGLAGVLPCSYLNEDDYEIGFILEKKSWGKGYAKEIGSAQIEQIKSELNKHRALAVVAPINKASIKSLEKLGFVYEKNTIIPRGERLVYSLVLK